jgi:FKBP-type peptidyl-prolyl cis-trans isomerase
MQKLFTNTTVSILTVAITLLASANAQQTPAAKPQTSSPASAKQDSSAKPKQAPTAKPRTAAPGAKTSPALSLKTPKDKLSYALGMNFGATLHKQSIEVDPAIVLRGLKDAVAGGKTLLTEEEARATLMQLQNDVRKRMQEKAQVAGEANKKEGQAFLDANKAKDGVVALPSGLQYKVLTAGTGPKPAASDTVVCNYRGTLIDGTEFDSSYKRGQPATFPVTGVIKGWTEALQLMPVGSKWQLFLPPDLAYGDAGAGPQIGPGATLIFEVELLSIQAPANPSPKP